MLEIVFSNDRVSRKVTRVVGVVEGSRMTFDGLNEEEIGLLRDYAAQIGFKGKKGSVAEFVCRSGRIVALGLGSRIDALSLQEAGGALYARLQNDERAVYLSESLKGCRLTAAEIADEIAFGLLLGSYRFDKYFTIKKAEDYPRLEQVRFKLKNAAAAAAGFKKYAALANAVRYGRDLCNEPANQLPPEVFAADIKRLEYLGLEVEILDRKKLAASGFGMLLAVAQGSAQESKVAIIKWRGNPKVKEWDLGLVGKGVTFDSGGISIKPAAHMEDMKGDMTGAAVVVSSLKALALQCAHKNVVGVVGLVENMPSGSATRPGDVVTSLSGQTVEIINTDAEGRLVLGDCLTYLQREFKVKKIVDIATLTGATMRALGNEYAGIFANDDKLAENLAAAGRASGEKLWRMPLGEYYDKQLNSDVADMKNVGGALGGGSTAACFLQRFVEPKTAWAHLDIAGVDKEEKGRPLTPKGATAFGIRLLNKFICS